MIKPDEIIREGRDAVIAERFAGLGPATNPYRNGTKRAFWWEHGAELARRAAKTLMEIGA